MKWEQANLKRENNERFIEFINMHIHNALGNDLQGTNHL